MKRLASLVGCALLAACTTTPKTEEVTPPAPPPAPAPIARPAPVFAPWYQVRERDVAEAHALDAAVRKLTPPKQLGVPVAAEIAKVAQKNDEGKTVAVDIWKTTLMGLPPTLLKKRAPVLQKAVELAGEFAADRSERMRIEIGAADTDRASLRKWLEAGVARAQKGVLSVDVRWTTLKRGELPFLRIAPVDPGYSFSPLSN